MSAYDFIKSCIIYEGYVSATGDIFGHCDNVLTYVWRHLQRPLVREINIFTGRDNIISENESETFTRV
jgi:hypothetical protein